MILLIKAEEPSNSKRNSWKKALAATTSKVASSRVPCYPWTATWPLSMLA